MLTAPLTRYGYPYMLIIPAVSLMYAGFQERTGYTILLTTYILSLAANLMVSFNTYDYNLIWPEDYKKNPYQECTLSSTNGTEYKFYYPLDGVDLLEGPCYYPFPSLPGKVDEEHLQMRGPDLSYGFRISK